MDDTVSVTVTLDLKPRSTRLLPDAGAVVTAVEEAFEGDLIYAGAARVAYEATNVRAMVADPRGT